MNEELLKNGDKETFKELIEENKKYLFNIAIAILKNEDDAGDAISETIIKAYKNLRKLKEAKFFKTWITRILINESNKILKSRSRTYSLEEWQDLSNEVKSDNISREEILDLRKALTKLSKEHYTVIMLFYYNELKIDDIAQILKVPVGTIKSRLNMARKNLYDQLVPEGGVNSIE